VAVQYGWRAIAGVSLLLPPHFLSWYCVLREQYGAGSQCRAAGPLLHNTVPVSGVVRQRDPPPHSGAHMDAQQQQQHHLRQLQLQQPVQTGAPSARQKRDM